MQGTLFCKTCTQHSASLLQYLDRPININYYDYIKYYYQEKYIGVNDVIKKKQQQHSNTYITLPESKLRVRKFVLI